MRDCLLSYMKVGIVHSYAFPDASLGPEIVDSIKRIAEDEFFGGIEIHPVPNDVRDIASGLVKSSRLELVLGIGAALVGENVHLNSLDSQGRKDAVSRYKFAIDEAYFLGASKLIVTSGVAPAANDLEQAKKLLIDSLAWICDYAENKGGITIALETFDRDMDRKRLIGPTKDAVEVASEVRKNHPNFGLLIDMSHLPLLRENPDYVLKTAKDYIVHIHIGNCVAKDKSHPLFGDKHLPFGIPGSENDVTELRTFLKVLLDIGYIGEGKQNVVAFEVKPLSGQSPEVVIANSKRVLLEAWAGLR